MEKEIQKSPSSTPASNESHPPAPEAFEAGAAVIYGLHGKCKVAGIEDRIVGEAAVPFYKLEVQKSSLSRSARQEPAIWIPVGSAADRGVRPPMSTRQAEAALDVLMSKEYYFPLGENWPQTQAKLENCIRTEGGIGLAKAYSFLFVLKKKLVVLSAEANKFMESVQKMLMRELTEALHRTPRSVEEQISKGLRAKTVAPN